VWRTSAAMALGAVQRARAKGTGAESRQQFGWVIVGGMAFRTLMTLFVVPVVYSLVASRTLSRAQVSAHDHRSASLSDTAPHTPLPQPSVPNDAPDSGQSGPIISAQRN